MPEGDRRIRVMSYSGYRGEESPRRFSLSGRKIDVVETLEAWVGQDPGGRAVKRYFRVRGDDGNTYCLYYHEEEKEWFCGE